MRATMGKLAVSEAMKSLAAAGFQFVVGIACRNVAVPVPFSLAASAMPRKNADRKP